jgi:flagellar hook-associated protein FlgK
MNLLNELLQIIERYEESTEFEDDVNKLESLLRDAKAIVVSKNWNDWMQASKSNYDTKSVEKSKKLLSTIQLAIDSVDDIYDELSDAS